MNGRAQTTEGCVLRFFYYCSVLTERLCRLRGILNQNCMGLGLWALLKLLFQLFTLMEIQITVAFIHRVLGSALLCDNIIVDNIVVWLLQNLPGLGDGLHESPLRNPKQLTVDGIVRIHTQESCVVFYFLILGTTV